MDRQMRDEFDRVHKRFDALDARVDKIVDVKESVRWMKKLVVGAWIAILSMLGLKLS